ncbi:DUF3488 and transglutaminase-like domain-containing protein [Paenibacillus sp. L3-i20]|uniref:transglutaminase TgpA family protein n=1 Tax=Paenibacillus sp. L3-i20 TaxID=2905833 RepID=UPI001EDD68C7|nr:DUF3488 and transglutaminase-like domain-containing protein [Paenibacillus sp. L3-i20]GKU78248.1 protease [Paenibacillus sp. L3-i20]
MKKPMIGVLAYFGKGWYTRLVALFITIIMLGSIQIFEDYWWPESFKIANYTLIIALLIDILLPMRMRIFKWSIQLVAAIAVTFNFARIEPLPIAPEKMGKLRWWFEHTIPQLDPFIWISLALLVIYILLSTWAVTRVRMFGVIGTGVLLLTIADSFTPIWLWDNVALVVFTGLVWLLFNHLDKLQRTHPESWKGLLEYPIRVVTPALIVLSLLMVFSLNVPTIAPLLQDPYTIWKNARGEEVQVFLGEKAIIDEDTLFPDANASSGYSRNDSILGGGFDFDFSPMMTVTTSQKSYWRGETKETYTGSGWFSIFPAELSAQFVQKDVALNEGNERSLAETIEVEQIVTMVRNDPYPVLFGAAPISKVNWIGSEGEAIPAGLTWLPSNWELIWNKDISYPTIYSLTSTVTVLDEEGLRKVEAAIPSTANIEHKYTTVPDGLPARVRELALEVTAAGTNDYDKAKLLENYLRTTYTYTNKPDSSKLTGMSLDFVDQFLFELMEGYCDYFSTAMAVMARTLDMPTRWVKGFSPGSLPRDRGAPPEDVMTGAELDSQQAGTYTVRNSDAHSWVEIYFEGYGWIPFEATAGFNFPYSMPEGEEVIVPDVAVNEADGVTKVADANFTGSKALLWAAASVFVLGVVVLLIIRRRDLAGVWIRLRTGSYSTNDQIVVETTRLLRICKKRGLRRDEHETLREAVTRWSGSYNRLRNDFQIVLKDFEKAKYGAEIASKEETDRFVTKVRYLMNELK